MISQVDDVITLSLHQVVVAQVWLATAAVLLADYGVFVLPAMMVVLWFWPEQSLPFRRGAIVTGCLAACVAIGLGLVLERTLSRPRPFVALGFTPLIPHVSDSSFPSDHTLTGVALIAALAVRSTWMGVLLFGWALLVGTARIAAGLHYTSDILGSALLALVLAQAAWWTTARLLGRIPRNPDVFRWRRSPERPGTVQSPRRASCPAEWRAQGQADPRCALDRRASIRSSP